MTGGQIDPSTMTQLEDRALYGGIILAALLLAAILTAMVALEAIAGRQDRRRAAQAAQRDAQRAAQLDAGTQAGWHDPSPADRRRDR